MQRAITCYKDVNTCHSLKLHYVAQYPVVEYYCVQYAPNEFVVTRQVRNKFV